MTHAVTATNATCALDDLITENATLTEQLAAAKANCDGLASLLVDTQRSRTDLLSELRAARQANTDLGQQREGLEKDLQGATAEIDRLRGVQRDLDRLIAERRQQHAAMQQTVVQAVRAFMEQHDPEQPIASVCVSGLIADIMLAVGVTKTKHFDELARRDGEPTTVNAASVANELQRVLSDLFGVKVQVFKIPD